jgi:Mn2+/Fe2+ NRAMP family transporter
LGERKVWFHKVAKKNTLKGAGFVTATGYSDAVKSSKKIEGRHIYVKTLFVR